MNANDVCAGRAHISVYSGKGENEVRVSSELKFFFGRLDDYSSVPGVESGSTASGSLFAFGASFSEYLVFINWV